MTLDTLRLTDIRIHRHSTFDCPPGVVILCGENGAGKTSVLEGISLLCTTRSFVSSQERGIVRHEAEGFCVEGIFRTDVGSRHTVKCEYPVNGRKQMLLDHAVLSRSSELIGRFPVVILSPQHRSITSGGPGERRSFMDFAISQIHHRYLSDLLEYRRILRHRNALLLRSDLSEKQILGHLDAWDETFTAHAERILQDRQAFLDQFQPYVVETLRIISEGREAPELSYRSTLAPDGTEARSSAMILERIRGKRSADLRMKMTTLGPHRDDLRLSFNGYDVRTYASQGQHKSLLIALKLAEFRYLCDHLEEQPILLLDDVFSELDEDRLARIFPLVRNHGQTFITTASMTVARRFSSGDGCAVYRIAQGDAEPYREVA